MRRVTARTARTRCWCSPTGRCSRARRSGHAPEDGVATGEVVFNTALSGYQEIVTDPSYAGQIITFTYPAHRQLRHQRRRRREPPAVLPRRRRARPRPPPEQLARDRRRSTTSSRRHGVPGIAGIDTRRLTRHLRDAGAIPGAFGTDEARCAPRPRPLHRRPTASTSSPRSPPTSPTRSATRPRAVLRRRLRLRHQAHDPAPPRRASGCHGRGGARRPTPAAAVLAREPDGVFLSNGPGDPAAVAGAAATVGALVGERARLRDLPRPPDPRPRARRRDAASCRSATTAPTTRCATRRPAGSRSRARTTTTRSTPTRSPVVVESRTST